MLYSLVKFFYDYIVVCELYGDPTVPVNRDHAKVCSPPLAYYFFNAPVICIPGSPGAGE